VIEKLLTELREFPESRDLLPQNLAAPKEAQNIMPVDQKSETMVLVESYPTLLLAEIPYQPGREGWSTTADVPYYPLPYHQTWRHVTD